LSESVARALASSDLKAPLPFPQLAAIGVCASLWLGFLVEGEIEIEVKSVPDRPPNSLPFKAILRRACATTAILAAWPAYVACTIGHNACVCLAGITKPITGWHSVKASAKDMARLIATITEQKLIVAELFAYHAWLKPPVKYIVFSDHRKVEFGFLPLILHNVGG